MVLAPPGCGKTDILAERIAAAKKRGVSYEDMLCLTFTNRASRGMRNRVQENVGDVASNIFVGNVHSFCSNFLYNNSLIPKNTAIIDDDDMASILLELGLNGGSPRKSDVSKIDNIDSFFRQRRLDHPASSISLPQGGYELLYQVAANAEFDPQKIDPLVISDGSRKFKDIVKITLLYQQYKKAHNIISFSDMLILAYEHLRNDKKRRFKRFKWIQVDEVQDLNSLQMAIIDELLDTTAPDFTAMYLGDEQQAIYSFLGAKLGQLQLLRQRCDGDVMTLGKNYRSPKYLLDIFNTYAKEQLGVDSAILPQSVSDDKHEEFDLILTSNNGNFQELDRVPKMIKYYLSFKDERVAILVPFNMTADKVSEKLLREGISHFKISGTDMFKSVAYKTVAAFFCVSVNDFNFMAWSRLLFGIGAIDKGMRARSFVFKLKSLMMTPSDLFGDKSYVARFCEDYKNRKFVFFDTETTGVNVLEDDIVQIAAFKVDCGKKVEGSDFNILLHTDKEIPSKLGDIDNPLTKIYASNPNCDRAKGLRLFLDYIGDCPVLAHNADYDYRILQENVRRTLDEQITLERFDSLRLIKCVEPDLRMYKLSFLLEQLHLKGNNSHVADEDIAATKSLVDYCYQKLQPMVEQQQAFVARQDVQNIVGKITELRPLFDDLRKRLYLPVKTTKRDLSVEIECTYKRMLAQHLLKGALDEKKFTVFLRYVQSEWINCEKEKTLFDQISSHVPDIAGSINEGDLADSCDIVNDRVFIMTVHKAKGLEFENVVVFDANDDVYPYSTVSDMLRAPKQHTAAGICMAQTALKEDARKFYVALSRAKKRLCISYIWRMSPFVKCIEHYFHHIGAK